MNVRGVAWIGLVGDRPETRAFYRDALGLRPIDEETAYATFAIDARARLEVLASGSRTAGRFRAGASMFGLLVDDVESAIAELRERGHAVDGGIHEWHDDTEVHRWTYLEDPEGHILQLVEVRPVA